MPGVSDRVTHSHVRGGAAATGVLSRGGQVCQAQPLPPPAQGSRIEISFSVKTAEWQLLQGREHMKGKYL